MSTEPPAPARKIPVAKLALVALVLVALAAVVLQVIGWQTVWGESRRMFSTLLDLIAQAGPLAFFTGMALLPAVGAPMAPFAMTAGAVFREQLGFPLLVLAGIVAITVNLTLTYWLARRWLRPFLARGLERFGYRLPQVESGDMTDLIILLRVTPGFPFFVQNYLLGLADAPFLRYLGISCGVQWTLNVAFMLFGDALSQGRGKLALTAILLLLAITAGTHLVRKHMDKKKVVR